MRTHVITIVFLFLTRARYPKSKSDAEIIRFRYSENTIKRIWKSEKLDYHLHNQDHNHNHDLQLLCKYDGSNVIPNFELHFVK